MRRCGMPILPTVWRPCGPACADPLYVYPAVRGVDMTTVSRQPEPPALSEQLVYRFGDCRAEGDGRLRNLLGGKGAGLAEMRGLGIPVPPGFTIATEVCNAFYQLGRRYPDQLEEQVRAGVTHIEGIVGARFGDAENPLLVSVRSGARVSMPGMMDTILNLGL